MYKILDLQVAHILLRKFLIISTEKNSCRNRCRKIVLFFSSFFIYHLLHISHVCIYFLSISRYKFIYLSGRWLQTGYIARINSRLTRENAALRHRTLSNVAAEGPATSAELMIRASGWSLYRERRQNSPRVFVSAHHFEWCITHRVSSENGYVTLDNCWRSYIRGHLAPQVACISLRYQVYIRHVSPITIERQRSRALRELYPRTRE